MGLFKTKKSELRGFNNTYMLLRTVLYKKLSERSNAPSGSREAVLLVQAMEYSLEERYDTSKDSEMVQSVTPDVPKKARELLKDKDTKYAVMAILMFKNEALTQLLKDEWTLSPEGIRVKNALGKYDRGDIAKAREYLKSIIAESGL